MEVYVINLERSAARRNYITDELAKFDLSPKFIPGSDRELINTTYHADYDPEMAKKWIGRQMGKGEIGCLLGHLRAFQQLINSHEEWAVILEDDAALFKNPVEALSGFDGNLVLGVFTSPVNQFRRKIKSREGEVIECDEVPYGGYCYAIHRKFAAQAIAHLRQGLQCPIDVYFRHRSREGGGGFWQVEGVANEHAIGQLSVIGDEARMHDRHPSAWRELETSEECPKLIHQIWVGPKPVPAGVSSWASMNPGRIHKLWRTNDLISILTDYEAFDAFREYLSEGLYPGAADIARLCILHRFGGLYADADSEAKRWFDITAPFVAWESETYRPGLLMNGFIQMKAGHPLMMDCLEKILEKTHPVPIYQIWKELGPQLLTDCAAKYPTINRQPSGLFVPDHHQGPNPDPGAEPYCTHDWDSTYKPVKQAQANKPWQQRHFNNRQDLAFA